jgi:hypothetical protein
MSQTVSLLPRERQTVITTKFSVKQPTVVSSEQPIDPSVVRAAHYSAQQQTVCAAVLSASCRTCASTVVLLHVAAQRAIIAALQRSDILLGALCASQLSPGTIAPLILIIVHLLQPSYLRLCSRLVIRVISYQLRFLIES